VEGAVALELEPVAAISFVGDALLMGNDGWEGEADAVKFAVKKRR
jgi:hypothetical protein